MKKLFKKIVLFSTVLALCAGIGVSATACSGGDKVLIGVGLYEASGPAVTAVKSYLNGIADDLNCEFTYVTLSTMDEAENKTQAQALISKGCQGMILTMDSSTETILSECEKAGLSCRVSVRLRQQL